MNHFQSYYLFPKTLHFQDAFYLLLLQAIMGSISLVKTSKSQHLDLGLIIHSLLFKKELTFTVMMLILNSSWLRLYNQMFHWTNSKPLIWQAQLIFRINANSKRHPKFSNPHNRSQRHPQPSSQNPLNWIICSLSQNSQMMPKSSLFQILQRGNL